MLGLGLGHRISRNDSEQIYRNVLSSAVGDWGINTSRLRLRRDSDNDEQEFDPIAGRYLDTSSISAWSGSDSVYVAKIFDRTGNGNHAIQATASSQPRLVDAGTFETLDDGSYGMYFDGSDDFLDVTDNSGLNITSGGLSLMAKHEPDALGGFLVCKNNTSFGEVQYALIHSIGQNATAFALEGSYVAKDNDNTNTLKNTIATYNFTKAKMYLNGVIKEDNSETTTLTARDNILIGCRSANADATTQSAFFTGHMNRIVVFTTALTQTQITLLNNRI